MVRPELLGLRRCGERGRLLRVPEVWLGRVRRLRSVVLRLRRLVLLGMQHVLQCLRRQLLPALPAALQAMPRRRLLRLSR